MSGKCQNLRKKENNPIWRTCYGSRSERANVIYGQRACRAKKIPKRIRKANESIPQLEVAAKSSIAKESKRGKYEAPQAYINENSPFSEEIQADPLPKNFKTMACEYK